MDSDKYFYSYWASAKKERGKESFCIFHDMKRMERMVYYLF